MCERKTGTKDAGVVAVVTGNAALAVDPNYNPSDPQSSSKPQRLWLTLSLSASFGRRGKLMSPAFAGSFVVLVRSRNSRGSAKLCAIQHFSFPKLEGVAKRRRAGAS